MNYRTDEQDKVRVSLRLSKGMLLAMLLVQGLSSSVAVEICAEGGGVKCEANPSLINLIADPGRYEGKLIYTTGVARVEHEGDRIYLTRQDAKHHVVENAVRFNLTGAAIDLDDMRKLNGDYVQIGGRLVTVPHPDGSGARLGVITEITMFRRK